jgi:hypothetical protein
MNFRGFEKAQIFTQNPKVLAYDLQKIASSGQKLTETQYFLVVAPILSIGYT